MWEIEVFDGASHHKWNSKSEPYTEIQDGLAYLSFNDETGYKRTVVVISGVATWIQKS